VCELRRSWSDVFDTFYTTGRWGGVFCGWLIGLPVWANRLDYSRIYQVLTIFNKCPAGC
jgi:hypothetical protein